MISDKADKGQRTVRLAELCSDAAPTAVELVVDYLLTAQHGARSADTRRDCLKSTIWNRNLTGTSGNSSLIRFRSHLWQKHW